RTAMPASPPEAGTSTEEPTACGSSTSTCSRTAAAFRSSTVRWSIPGARARSSTTSGDGAGPNCRDRPESPSTYAGRAAGSPRRASMSNAGRRPPRPPNLSSASASCVLVAPRLVRAPAPGAALVPAVEESEVARVPGLAEPRFAEVPVRADLLTDRPEVLPEVDDGGPSPEPVTVVDAVDDQSGLQHDRVRNHWIVLGVRVLLDVEVLLDDAAGVGEEWPLGADRVAELLERVMFV